MALTWSLKRVIFEWIFRSAAQIRIICNIETEERVNTHVGNRETYVQGCGQLCNACYLRCHNNSTVDWYMNYMTE